MSQTSKSRQIICSSCGGVFDENLPMCPYCNTLNIEGAEKEYFEKLEDVREDMEKLADVPVEEVKITLKKQTKLIRRVIVATVAVVLALLAFAKYTEYRDERDVKADYMWKLENFPQMDEWYEQGNYDELIEFYWNSSLEDHPVWAWEHSDFVMLYDHVLRIQEKLKREQNGEELDIEALENMFYSEWCIIGMPFRSGMPEEDLQQLESYIPIAESDVRERFALTEEEYNYFYEQVEQEWGYPPRKECYAFVDSKMEDKGAK